MAPALLDETARILFLDAYDSFSNNIIAQVEQNVNAEITQIHIDDPRFTEFTDIDKRSGLKITNALLFVEYLKTFDAVIAGPGPGWANQSMDVGLINELWKLQEA